MYVNLNTSRFCLEIGMLKIGRHGSLSPKDVELVNFALRLSADGSQMCQGLMALMAS